MKVLGVLWLGFLRICQANANKLASGYTSKKDMVLRFCLFFDIAATFFSFLYLFAVGFNGFNLITLLCSVVMGMAFVIEVTSMLECVKSAPLVLCNICAMGGGIIAPTIMGTLFYGDNMKNIQWLGVALFFLSVYMFSSKQNNKKLSVKTLLFLLLNFFANSVCGIVNQFFAEKVVGGNPSVFSFLSYFSAAIITTILIIFSLKKPTLRLGVLKLPRRALILGGALGIICSTLLYFNTILIRMVPIVIVNTIPSIISIVGCFVLGLIFFGEKLTFKNIIGVIVGALAAVLLV